MAKKPQKASPAKKPAKAKVPAKVAPAKPAKQEFTLKRGEGNKVFKGFDPITDRITFDFGSYVDPMFEGSVGDNTTFTNDGRTATWYVRAIGDDTLITVDADTILLVGVKADELRGWNFVGG